MALLYDGSDCIKPKHKDHLHPACCFNEKKLKKLNIADDKFDFYLNKNNWNSILNLQLLDGNDNKSKNNKSLKDWINEHTIDCKKRLIPKKFIDIKDFEDFIEERKKILTKRLKEVFK